MSPDGSLPPFAGGGGGGRPPPPYCCKNVGKIIHSIALTKPREHDACESVVLQPTNRSVLSARIWPDPSLRFPPLFPGLAARRDAGAIRQPCQADPASERLGSRSSCSGAAYRAGL